MKKMTGQQARLIAETIIRDLANGDAPVDSEFGHCMTCSANSWPENLLDHKVSCVWRRAVEWVENKRGS